MGNKILGKRSRSFYKGFNERQMDYLRQKFEMISANGILNSKKFMQSYKLTKQLVDNFFIQVDFDNNSQIDEYQFICAVHSLCSCTIEQLGDMFYRILTNKKGKNKLNEDNLLGFTKACLQYNAYLDKTKIDAKQIKKINKNKFQKYDYDHNKELDRKQFISICLKDEDYKQWMFNMGFITKRQLQFQQSFYQLVDSDICDEVDRNCQKTDKDVSNIKQGIQHRLEQDQFDLQETVGQQSAPADKPWKKSIKKIKIDLQNPQPPSQTLQIDYIFGYRSFDCRNNIKFNTKGQIVYHQAAVGIVLEPKNNSQSFIVEHHDDISCLDVKQDTVVTGEVGAKPQLIIWQSIKQDNSLKSKMIITQQLKDSVSNVCMSQSKNLLAAVCNDQDHHLIIYDLKQMQKKQKNPTLQCKTITASGSSTKNIVFDIKFQINDKRVVVATLREILFVSFEKGSLNANRGNFGNFSVSPTFCLEPLNCKYKGQQKQYMLSGMGNGSVYFWEDQKCVKAVSGHSGSVSALARRKQARSFVSGDKTGKVIIWNDKLQKQKTLNVPKSNCPSNMIVSLSCSSFKQLVIGTKSSDMYLMGIGQSFDKAQKIMSGHSDGQLWAMVLHRTKPYLYTGGQDQRLIKWQYVKQRKILKQRKCPYKIRSIDFNYRTQLLVVGYQNGVIQCFKAEDLEKTQHQYTEVKNPDQQALNIVKFNKDASVCAVCYQLPHFHIALIAVGESKMKKISEINDKHSLKNKVIALDFERQSNFIRVNTDKYEYLVFDIKDAKNPSLKPADSVKEDSWVTNSLPFSPKTQGLMTEGVYQQDIVCCERSRKHKNTFVIGDKYSKIKLFNCPSVDNQIFSKYSGHSNAITALQFSRDFDILVSLGGEQKSVIIWKYDPDLVKNQWFIKKLDAQSDIEEGQISQERLRKVKLMDQYAMQEQEGEQALAVKPFLGQLKKPSNFDEKYNPRRDNKEPQENISIRHAFGLRNKYLKDQVRNQCRFSKNYKNILFPTACLGVKMSIETRKQEFYHQHKEDIVSFAIDSKRQLMATGQMAEKNPYAPRKKILSIYIWDIQGNKMLQKLDGFHTIAIVLLQFSPNSKYLFTCGNDDKNTFAVYDWMSGSIMYSGPVSRAKVNGIAWKNDNQFVTCGMDHVKFWTGKKGQLGRIDGKTEGMFSCVSSKRVYITGSGDGGIYNWVGNRSGKKNKAHKGKVHSLVYFKDYIYSGGDDGKILAWRTEANGQIKVPDNYFDTRSAFEDIIKTVAIPEEQFGVLSIDFSPNKQLLVATKGTSVILYSNKKTDIIHQGHWKGELWGLSTLIKSGNDSVFVTGGDDKSVRLWDIEKRCQIKRTYFSQKIRGLDWSLNQNKIVVADSRAKVYLLNKELSILSQYTGKPYDFNKKQKNPFVQEIKFSPDGKLIAYGCHGKSMYMEYLSLSGNKLQNHKTFTQGSSAVLHLDWTTDSSQISLNSQAYQLLFYDTRGQKMTASSTADNVYATWTQKLGFPVQGIFQGVDYSDVNTVCRDPSQQFLAVGYDDQTVRLFKYPCYIDKQVCKTFTGHSSHVTRIKFTSQYMVSLGGLDRTIIVWDVQRPGQDYYKDDGQQSDGLQDLDEDVDVNMRVLQKPKKQKKIEQFYEVQDEGDQFMAVKPWLGAIKSPTYEYPQQTTQKPSVELKLQYVHGYRCKDTRQNLFYVDKQTILFHAAAVVIQHNIEKNTQHLMAQHNDDILSIDFHKETNTILTGQLGPKPLLCMFRDGQLQKSFSNPVSKGILSVSINHDGTRAVCIGMDDDHHVALLDLEKGIRINKVKGTKKIVIKILWTEDNQFVTLGINHFKHWRVDGKNVQGKQSRKRGNFVSAVYDKQTKTTFTGASGGIILPWKGSSYEKQIIIKTKDKSNSKGAVVDSLAIHGNLLLAGTKNGEICVFKKSSKELLNTFNMQSQFRNTDVRSQCAGIRAINILENKMIIGTLGAEIYEFKFRNLESDKKLGDGRNILKCHYSPNNTWTNQVWGLHIYKDYIFTCSDDATVRCWSLSSRKLICCANLNVGPDNIPLDKDKRTKDFSDAAKGRAVSVSPDGKQVIVGSKNGTVRVYKFDEIGGTMKFKMIFRHAKQWISDIKFAYNTLIIGSHDNGIYVYNYEDGEIKRKFRPLKKHSSYITHMDASRDSCFLQSTCGAYQLLFWDLNTGKQLTSGASMLKDERWATWTCNLGWPVQGIYPKCTDGTYINAVDRSHFSINGTLAKDDSRSPFLLAAGNDDGKVAVYNYPCTIKSSKYAIGKGHSSHVTTVRWSDDDNHILSVGGEDQCLMYWKVQKKKQ